MIKLEVTEQELNMVLKSLYLLEDQEWFRGHQVTEPLIKKLNENLDEEYTRTGYVVCDI